MHGDRDEDVGIRPLRGASEAPGRHSHDGHGLPVDGEDGVQDPRVGPQLGLPIVIAQDGHEVPPDGPVVLGGQESSQGRLESQHREVGSGDEHAFPADGLSGVRQVCTEEPVSGDAGKAAHPLFLKVPEHGVAEDEIAVPGLVAGLGTGLRPRRPQVHQAFRLPHWQAPEEELFEEGEDGGVRPDPQRQ